MQQHPVFIRQLSEDKAILCTVIDPKDFNIDMENDSFIMGSSSKGNPYTGMNPTMTFVKDSQMPAEEYVETLRKELGYDIQIRGNSIDGILQQPLWFIKKMKSAMEQMLGM